MTDSPETRNKYHCSFCGKSQDEVFRLIAGPGKAYICDQCVQLCREIIDDVNTTVQPPGPGDMALLRLWTPWRMAFIEQATRRPAGGDPGCFLCTKPAQSSEQDRDSLILYRGQRAYVLMNLYPYNSGHLMVAPYVHTGDLPALADADAQELFALVRGAVEVLRAEYRPEGFNVGMNLGQAAGAGVPKHLHVHLVPRWNGDTNFMPIVGHTKVLPESLEQTYDRLLPRFQAWPSTTPGEPS